MRRKLRRISGERQQADLEHAKVQAELDRHEKQIVDLAARLVRLEAEVEIYRPFIINEKGSK